DEVLVFVNTKIYKIPKVELLEVASYYKKEGVHQAKEKLFRICKEKGAAEGGLKYEERKNSNRIGAQEMDLEDIYGYFQWLQGRVEVEEMPQFVNVDADNRPLHDSKWLDAN